MAIQQINEGISGQQAANLIYANDVEAAGVLTYAAGTYYLNQKVAFNGIIYRVKAANTTTAPPSADWEALGAYVPLWVAGRYETGDLRRNAEGLVYISLSNANTAVLTDETKWKPLGINTSTERNYYSLNYKQIGIDGADLTANGGTDFLPITVGATLYTNAVGVANIAGLAVFNASNEFIEHFDFPDWYDPSTNNRQSNRWKSYTFTQANYDAGWRFFRCSFFGENSTTALLNIFTVPRPPIMTNQSLTRIKDRHTDDVTIKRLSNNVNFTFGSTGTVTTDANGNRLLTIGAGESVTMTSPDVGSSFRETGHDMWYFLLEVEAVSVATGDTVTFTSLDTYGIKVGQRMKLSTGNGNAFFTQLVLGGAIKVSFAPAVACVLKVVHAGALMIHRDYALRFLASQDVWPYIVPNDQNWQSYITKFQFTQDFDFSLLDKGFDMAGFAEYARVAKYHKVSPIYERGYYVSFGDSITDPNSPVVPANADIVARYMSMPHRNLAVSGSRPTGGSNLSDAQLALIPSNVMLVSITGGQNGWTTSSDITTRVRTTSIGAINYAIDFIKALNPRALVTLITSPNDVGGNHADYVRLADYWKCPLLEIHKKIDFAGDVGVNVLRISDNIHPTELGQWRMAAVMLHFFREYVI